MNKETTRLFTSGFPPPLDNHEFPARLGQSSNHTMFAICGRAPLLLASRAASRTLAPTPALSRNILRLLPRTQPSIRYYARPPRSTRAHKSNKPSPPPTPPSVAAESNITQPATGDRLIDRVWAAGQLSQHDTPPAMSSVQLPRLPASWGRWLTSAGPAASPPNPLHSPRCRRLIDLRLQLDGTSTQRTPVPDRSPCLLDRRHDHGSECRRVRGLEDPTTVYLAHPQPVLRLGPRDSPRRQYVRLRLLAPVLLASWVEHGGVVLLRHESV